MYTRKKIVYRNTELVYGDHGDGPCIFLVHGYLETGEIWVSFARKLANEFRVITVDLPGHGDSGSWGKVHTMDELAGSILSVLDAESIDKVFLVGHSMGGYVSMAFADLYADRLRAYSLFHSTCFADSDEKKHNRDREISLVLCGRKRQIITVNIPKGFAEGNLDRMEDQVNMAKKLALKCPDNGIISILNGMKERPDRTHILEDPKLPLLLIGGMKDNYIPEEVFEKLVKLAPHATVLRLEQSGHMGFLEEPDKAAEAIRALMKQY